jgi:hypothetical protein
MRTDLAEKCPDGLAKIWRFWIGHQSAYAGVLGHSALQHEVGMHGQVPNLL